MATATKKEKEPRDLEDEVAAASVVTTNTAEATILALLHRATQNKVDVVRTGDKIILPEGMSNLTAIDALKRKEQEEQMEVGIHHVIDGYPLDGAIAFQKALDRLYGWTEMLKTPGFFTDYPPVLVNVRTGPQSSKQVTWGRLSFPKISGYLETGMSVNPPAFVIGGKVKAKDRAEVAKLADLTRQILREESVYKAQAIRVNWEWKRNGDRFNPESHAPKFLELAGVREEDLIFPATTQRVIDLSLFTPLEHTEASRAAGIPLKRGVLLEGPYGVGKTLTAHVTASKATRNGWTFIYVEDIRDLAEAIEFARNYAPAVLFAEDIDRVVAGERDIKMDEILNIIDGIESKGIELITVLTTNHVENINRALLRPGRLDSVVSVRPPDSDAAQKLIRLYGRGLLKEGIDLSKVGQALDGEIPAFIREVVERAKLGAIRHAEGNIAGSVTEDDLIDAAASMKMHMDLLREKKETPPSPGDAFIAAVADRVSPVVQEQTKKIMDALDVLD